MEMFGILGAIPAAFVATAVYSNVLWRVPLTQRDKRVLFAASLGVLGTLLLEWILLLTIGAVAIRSSLGPIFYPAHLAVFILANPASANLLIAAWKAAHWRSSMRVT